jgi:hypothetical protein
MLYFIIQLITANPPGAAAGAATPGTPYPAVASGSSGRGGHNNTGAGSSPPRRPANAGPPAKVCPANFIRNPALSH